MQYPLSQNYNLRRLYRYTPDSKLTSLYKIFETPLGITKSCGTTLHTFQIKNFLALDSLEGINIRERGWYLRSTWIITLRYN